MMAQSTYLQMMRSVKDLPTFNKLPAHTLLCATTWIHSTLSQGPPRSKNLYASILQDTRNEPTPDGTFGYLYKTEDGIVSSARGGPNGVIQGGFSYTDPTGLKVNINYNAGSRTSPTATEPSTRTDSGQYREQPEAPAPAPSYYGNEINTRPRVSARAPVYRQEPEYYEESVQDVRYQVADQTQPRYITRPQPVYRPQPEYRPRSSYYSPNPAYRPSPVYRPQQRRPRPVDNEIYDEYSY